MFSGACTKSFLFARHFFHLKLSKNYIATCVGLSGTHNAPPIAVSLHLIFPLLPRRRTSQDEEHEELPNQHGRSEKCCAAVTLVPRPLICCDQTVSRDVSVPISLLQAVHSLLTLSTTPVNHTYGSGNALDWIKTWKKEYMIGCLYRPPNSSVKFWSSLEDALGSLEGYEVILMGDLNADFSDQRDKNYVHMEHVCLSLNLRNLISSSPTRIRATQL